jgi:hypothetical protein
MTTRHCSRCVYMLHIIDSLAALPVRVLGHRPPAVDQGHGGALLQHHPGPEAGLLPLLRVRARRLRGDREVRSVVGATAVCAVNLCFAVNCCLCGVRWLTLLVSVARCSTGSCFAAVEYRGIEATSLRGCEFMLCHVVAADTYLSAVLYPRTQTEGGLRSRGPAPSARRWAPWRSSTTGTRPWHAAYEYSSTLLRDDMSSSSLGSLTCGP